MEWAFETRTFREMGIRGRDRRVPAASTRPSPAGGAPGIGVEIMGRNKFGPLRGPWDDEEWTGWWGENPVFHTPVVVLTHHPRPVLEMAGGTTFHFVDADPVSALQQARALAGGLDVRIGGGVSTVRQFLEADLIDHMHLVLVPIVLGRGERLWDGLEGLEERFAIEATPSPLGVLHLVFTRKAG